MSDVCVQVVEYNATSSLYEQLLQMSRTGVYVSVHTSNLANAPLLQPGSAVVELLHVRGVVGEGELVGKERCVGISV